MAGARRRGVGSAHDHPDDPKVGVVSGVAEMIHKLSHQLPPDEQLGGPKALILDGSAVYKMFHRGAAFGSQLTQTVRLPAGARIG